MGFSNRSTGKTKYASNSPDNPPSSANSVLSVKSCRANRHQSAPSDRRKAISRSRVTPRASNKVATFPQQMNNRNPTAADSVNSAFSILPSRSPRTSCRNVIKVTPQPARSRGYSRSKSRAIPFNSPSACCKLTLGFSLATNSWSCAARSASGNPSAFL